MTSATSSKRSSVAFDDSVNVFEFEPRDQDAGSRPTSEQKCSMHRKEPLVKDDDEKSDMKSEILDADVEQNKNDLDEFLHQPQSAIYKLPLASFITQVSSSESIFDKYSSSDSAKKRKHKVQLTAQNSHPSCFEPVTASRIHGGVLGKRQYRPRKSRKQIIVRNEINFPPIRSSHTAPESSQRNTSQIITRRMTIFAKSVVKNTNFDIKALKRPTTNTDTVGPFPCSRYGRPYNRRVKLANNSRHTFEFPLVNSDKRTQWTILESSELVKETHNSPSGSPPAKMKAFPSRSLTRSTTKSDSSNSQVSRSLSLPKLDAQRRMSTTNLSLQELDLAS